MGDTVDWVPLENSEIAAKHQHYAKVLHESYLMFSKRRLIESLSDYEKLSTFTIDQLAVMLVNVDFIIQDLNKIKKQLPLGGHSYDD